jgi:acyl carrier protein
MGIDRVDLASRVGTLIDNQSQKGKHVHNSIQDAAYSRVLHTVVATTGVPEARLAAGSELPSLGLDSLAMLEIGLGLEKEYGVSFDDGALAQVRTLDELVELVRQTTASESD